MGCSENTRYLLSQEGKLVVKGRDEFKYLGVIIKKEARKRDDTKHTVT